MVERAPVMDVLLSEPPTQQNCDLAKAIAAVERGPSVIAEQAQPAQSPGPRPQPRSLEATHTRRVLAITALGALLIGSITVLTSSSSQSSAITATGATRNEDVFNSARSGDCLSWPKNQPEDAYFVNCGGRHLFEVAESVDMHGFSQQPCQLAVQHYLGNRYDPNSKFTSSVLWSASQKSGGGQLLCGLQLPGPDKQPIAFEGKVAALDQSKVWPAGTCLGIDSNSQQPTDIPVDCSAPHSEEVTGTVNLADKFTGAAPTQPDQDAFIRDACTRTTDAYLAPVALTSTGLTLMYSTVAQPSWLAGSRQVSCRIGLPQESGGWSILLGSAKGRLLINGQLLAAAPTGTAPAPQLSDERPDTPPTAVATQVAVTNPVQSAPSPVQSVPTPAQAAPTPAQATPSPAQAAPAPSAVPTPAPPPAAAQSPPPQAEPAADAPMVIEIPGLAPITLPRWPPPPPPAPEP
jgi:Septum formation